MKKGKFIVLEGADGSGKTTQLELLKKQFTKQNLSYHETAEPTDGPIGSLIRNILNRRIQADETTIAALYLSDRLDHIQNKTNGILSFLNKGIHVISSRYYFSSFAYQVSDTVSLDWLIEAHRPVRALLKPDLNIFIDIPVEESMRRLQKGRSFLDIFENEEKIAAVRQGYNNAFEKIGDEENLLLIDGLQSVEDIHGLIWKATKNLMADG